MAVPAELGRPSNRRAGIRPLSALLGPSDIRALCAQLDLHPTKSLGQNFVVDPGTVRKIAALGLSSDFAADDDCHFGQTDSLPAALVSSDDDSSPQVLEIGPGLGSLTLALLETGARVTAVEIDPVLAAALPRTVAQRAPEWGGRLEIVTADALQIDALPGAAPTVLIANLPYNVAVPVILRCFERFASIRRAVVMVQAEVADRLVADPGSRVYGVPSAKRAWFASARRAGRIGRSVFFPVPRVDSALVALERRDPPDTSAARAEVFSCIDAAFSQRRKMLRSALGSWAGSTSAAEAVLVRAGIDPTARGERLSIADFARLAAAKTEVVW